VQLMALRWGICSAGKITADFCTALRLQPDHHHVVAVAARDLSRAQNFASLYGSSQTVARAYGNYEELSEDSNVDVIYVGTIHPQHHQLVLMFLRAKKAVLCEKPMGMNVAETEDMLAAARENQVFFMEAVWSRFNPIFTALRSPSTSDMIGDVQLVHANFCADCSDNQRTYDPKLGGGATLDIGIYTLTFALWMFRGEVPESVNAVGGLWNDHNTDQWANVTLRYSGGRSAHLSYHSGIQGNCTADVSGTRGFARISAPFWATEELWINEKLVKSALAVPPERESELKFNYMNSGHMIHEAEEVRKCLHQNKLQSDIMTHADSLQLAKLMENIMTQLAV